MAGVFSVGGYVESRSEADGSVTLRCPSCGHYTPGIRAPQLVPHPQNRSTEAIDCACLRSEGLQVVGVLRPTGCDCVARYRVQPTSTSGRYVVTAIDLVTMEQRLQARAQVQGRQGQGRQGQGQDDLANLHTPAARPKKAVSRGKTAAGRHSSRTSHSANSTRRR